jgi:RTX toxin RtxA
MLGMYKISTKVGDGDVIGGMFGVGNVLTHVGDGFSAALMIGGTANIFTKVGNGITLAAMV